MAITNAGFNAITTEASVARIAVVEKIVVSRSVSPAVATIIFAHETKPSFHYEMVPAELTPTLDEAMALAISIARKSKAEDDSLHPNVGAVVVHREQILGSAFRGELGAGDHAEFTLFEKKLVGSELKGAILCTTLEPCTTRKRHKPCAQWIAEKELACVFIGMLDPNPRIYSLGVSYLRRNGIAVEFFPNNLRESIRHDNRRFIESFHANPELYGEATFNYTQNNGCYSIGHGELLFETKWSRGGASSIHVYKGGSIDSVGIAQGVESFADVRDATAYDMSSRTQLPREGEIVVLKNVSGKFAVVQIVDVKARSHGDTYDALSIEYRINPDGSSLFRD